jgi:TetR/AcrR family transcriptional regulator
MGSADANHVADTLTAAWDAALAEAGLPVDRIKALIGAQLGQIAAMPMLLFSRELNVDNAALRVAFRGQLAAFHGHQMREIAEGQQSQTLRGDEAVADSAVLLTSLIQGWPSAGRLGRATLPCGPKACGC